MYGSTLVFHHNGHKIKGYRGNKILTATGSDCYYCINKFGLDYMIMASLDDEEMEYFNTKCAAGLHLTFFKKRVFFNIIET
jgi:hypothetical protein